MSKKLKTMAVSKIKECDYSVSAKKQLMNFINEANDIQLKALILDGNIEKIEEDSIDIINKRFDNLIELENNSLNFILRETIYDYLSTELDDNKFDLEDIKEYIMNEISDNELAEILEEDALDTTLRGADNVAKFFAGWKGSGGDKTVSDVYKGISKKVGQTKIGHVGGIVLAAMIAAGAYKIYKNYLSKAARGCAGKADKAACMKSFKINAIKAQINKLKQGMSQCSKSKDPQKCKISIQNKINNLSKKL